MSDHVPGSAYKRTPLRARHLFYGILIVLGCAYIAAPEFWLPWAHLTGGSFHIAHWWSGAGTFAGPDGSYQVYLYLEPLHTTHATYDTALTGRGHLCTPSGDRWVLEVSGDMDKHLPRNTLGQKIEINTFARSKPGSFSGMEAPGAPYLRLNGIWGTGKIEARGTLEHQAAAEGKPKPPPAAPIAVTLQKSSDWWAPACNKP
jgi:hypothetical protein